MMCTDVKTFLGYWTKTGTSTFTSKQWLCEKTKHMSVAGAMTPKYMKGVQTKSERWGPAYSKEKKVV